MADDTIMDESPRLPKPRPGDPVTRLNELEDRIEALEAAVFGGDERTENGNGETPAAADDSGSARRKPAARKKR